MATNSTHHHCESAFRYVVGLLIVTLILRSSASLSASNEQPEMLQKIREIFEHHDLFDIPFTSAIIGASFKRRISNRSLKSGQPYEVQALSYHGPAMGIGNVSIDYEIPVRSGENEPGQGVSSLFVTNFFSQTCIREKDVVDVVGRPADGINPGVDGPIRGSIFWRTHFGSYSMSLDLMFNAVASPCAYVVMLSQSPMSN